MSGAKGAENKINTIKTMYILGVPTKIIEKFFGYQYKALCDAGVLRSDRINKLRAVCTMRSMLTMYGQHYMNSHGSGKSLYESVPYWAVNIIEYTQEDLESVWDEGSVHDVFNFLSNVINKMHDVLEELGIENAEMVFKAFFHLPALNRSKFCDLCNVYREKELHGIPWKTMIPHADLYGERLDKIFLNDDNMYEAINFICAQNINNGMHDYNVRRDYPGNVIHYIDVENNHPFHVMQVCNAAPDKHGIKLFYEIDSGVAEQCGDRCEKYKVRQIINGKSQVDQALMSNIGRDRPDVAIIHSGDCDYYATIEAYHDIIKFVVVTRRDSISLNYLDELEKLGVEVYCYSDDAFSSVEIEPLINAEVVTLMRNTPYINWDVDDFSDKIANILVLRRDRVRTIVENKYKNVSKVVSSALA